MTAMLRIFLLLFSFTFWTTNLTSIIALAEELPQSVYDEQREWAGDVFVIEVLETEESFTLANPAGCGPDTYYHTEAAVLAVNRTQSGVVVGDTVEFKTYVKAWEAGCDGPIDPGLKEVGWCGFVYLISGMNNDFVLAAGGQSFREGPRDLCPNAQGWGRGGQGQGYGAVGDLSAGSSDGVQEDESSSESLSSGSSEEDARPLGDYGQGEGEAGATMMRPERNDNTGAEETSRGNTEQVELFRPAPREKASQSSSGGSTEVTTSTPSNLKQVDEYEVLTTTTTESNFEKFKWLLIILWIIAIIITLLTCIFVCVRRRNKKVKKVVATPTPEVSVTKDVGKDQEKKSQKIEDYDIEAPAECDASKTVEPTIVDMCDDETVHA